MGRNMTRTNTDKSTTDNTSVVSTATNNANVDELVNQNKNENENSNANQNESFNNTTVVIENSVVRPVEHRNFVPGDMISCRCVRPNKVVFYSTKTDTRYEFGGYGDVNEVDYSDLLKLKSSKSPILYQPKILIEDEELRKQWARDLSSIAHEYEGIYETEELFEKTPNEFETFLRNASDGVKNLVKLSASTLIKEEKLTDLRLIRIIDDVLGTQYKDFI